MIQRRPRPWARTTSSCGMAMLFIALIPVVWLARPPFRAIGMGGAH